MSRGGPWVSIMSIAGWEGTGLTDGAVPGCDPRRRAERGLDELDAGGGLKRSCSRGYAKAQLQNSGWYGLE